MDPSQWCMHSLSTCCIFCSMQVHIAVYPGVGFQIFTGTGNHLLFMPMMYPHNTILISSIEYAAWARCSPIHMLFLSTAYSHYKRHTWFITPTHTFYGLGGFNMYWCQLGPGGAHTVVVHTLMTSPRSMWCGHHVVRPNWYSHHASRSSWYGHHPRPVCC